MNVCEMLIPHDVDQNIIKKFLPGYKFQSKNVLKSLRKLLHIKCRKYSFFEN